MLFVFNGDPMCFIHVLLNGLDMHENGYEVGIILEGASTKLAAELPKTDHPLNGLWEKARAAGIVEGICRACARKMGTLDAALEQGLTALDDMNGHPGMARYRDAGFDIITF